MKEGLIVQAEWFLEATVDERMDAGRDAEGLIRSLLVEMQRLERVLPRYKAIVRDLARYSEPVRVFGGDPKCSLCGRSLQGRREPDHDPDCPWRRARELQQGATE